MAMLLAVGVSAFSCVNLYRHNSWLILWNFETCWRMIYPVDQTLPITNYDEVWTQGPLFYTLAPYDKW